MPREQGLIAKTYNQLARLSNTHFKQLFKAPPGSPLVGHFPRFVEPDLVEDLIKPVTMGELEGTPKWFEKDKSPRLDGWSVEFYLTFFDIIGPDLPDVIEECRTSGRMYEPINSTYIALIPKTNSPPSFNDFRPISLVTAYTKLLRRSLLTTSS